MITDGYLRLMAKIPHQKDKELVDSIHGWSDYSEERYNSKRAGIIIAVVSGLYLHLGSIAGRMVIGYTR